WTAELTDPGSTGRLSSSDGRPEHPRAPGSPDPTEGQSPPPGRLGRGRLERDRRGDRRRRGVSRPGPGGVDLPVPGGRVLGRVRPQSCGKAAHRVRGAPAPGRGPGFPGSRGANLRAVLSARPGPDPPGPGAGP